MPNVKNATAQPMSMTWPLKYRAMSGEVGEGTVRQRHEDNTGGQHCQRRAPPGAGPGEHQDRDGDDRDIRDGVRQRKAQCETACAAGFVDTPATRTPTRSRTARPRRSTRRARIERANGPNTRPGKSAIARPAPIGEHQITGVGKRRKRGLVEHRFVVDPQRLTDGPSGQSDRQADPRFSLPALGRPG